MSSACAGLLRHIDEHCENAAACFCHVYGALKSLCGGRPCKKEDFNYLCEQLRSMNGAMSRHVVQIICLTSLTTLGNGLVRVTIDGCLDRFISYIFNYAAIHFLSSLQEVRCKVDGFKTIVCEMIFGATEEVGRKTFNLSACSGGYEESVHDLTTEGSVVDIVEAMDEARCRGLDKDKESAILPDDEDAGSGTGIFEKGTSMKFLPKEQPLSTHRLLDEAIPVDDKKVSISVLHPGILNQQRTDVFQTDAVFAFLQKDEVAVASVESASSNDHDTISSDSMTLIDCPRTDALRTPQVVYSDVAMSSDETHTRAGVMVATQNSLPSRTESGYGQEQIVVKDSMLTGVTAPPADLSFELKKKEKKRKQIHQRRSRREAALISRLMQPKNKNKRRPPHKDEGRSADVMTGAADSAASRRHWFGQTLWRSSIMVKEEETWYSPIRAKTHPDRCKRRSRTIAVSQSDDKQGEVISPSQIKRSPNPTKHPQSQQEIDASLISKKKCKGCEHPNVAQLFDSCSALIETLIRSPNNKYYENYDVRGTRKEFSRSICTLQDKLNEVHSLADQAAAWRASINDRYGVMNRSVKLETFDESFFGADEKVKIQERHRKMNENYRKSLLRIEAAVDAVATFAEKLSVAHQRHSQCPSNVSQQYLEKLCIRKSKALMDLMEDINRLNSRVIDHCSNCLPDGTRPNDLITPSFLSHCSSLTLGKSWRRIIRRFSRSLDDSPGSKNNASTYNEFAMRQSIIVRRMKEMTDGTMGCSPCHLMST